MFDRSETHFMKEAGSERESEHLRDVFRSGFFDQGLDNSAAGGRQLTEVKSRAVRDDASDLHPAVVGELPVPTRLG